QHVRLHLKPALGSLALAAFRPVHASDLYAALDTSGVSAAMRAKVATTLRAALEGAVRLQLVPVNHALAVSKPRGTRRPAVHPWDADQARAFLEKAAADRLSALYVLALDTGMRQGELFGLHWPEVDLDAGALRVIRSLQDRNGILRVKAVKTPTSRRRLRLTPSCVADLREHRERMRGEGRDVEAGPVFVDTAGGFLRKENLRRESCAPVFKRAGVPAIRFHDLRHTHPTLLLLNGINVKAVSVRLGHSTARITLDTYSHFMPEMEEQTVATVERIFGGPGSRART